MKTEHFEKDAKDNHVFQCIAATVVIVDMGCLNRSKLIRKCVFVLFLLDDKMLWLVYTVTYWLAVSKNSL